MANQLSGQTGPSPREYSAHRRHSHFAERRHDDQAAAFLAQQATRLGGGATSAIVFAKIAKYGAARVKAAVNLAALP